MEPTMACEWNNFCHVDVQFTWGHYGSLALVLNVEGCWMELKIFESLVKAQYNSCFTYDLTYTIKTL
jgi:hypothetical protein